MSKLKAYKVSPTIIDLEWKQLVEGSAVGYELEYAISPEMGWQPVMPAHEGTESVYRHEDLIPEPGPQLLDLPPWIILWTS